MQQMTIWCLRNCMPDTYSYTHTPHLIISNTHCFSTATLVARTRLHVKVLKITRLIVYYLYGLGNGPAIFSSVCLYLWSKTTKENTLRSWWFCFIGKLPKIRKTSKINTTCSSLIIKRKRCTNFSHLYRVFQKDLNDKNTLP